VDVVGVLPAFLVAVALIWAAPGPAMLLVLQRAALRGTRSAFAAVLGLGVGLVVWAGLAALGLGALVAASQTAYDVLRLAGAVFLVALGAHTLHGAWRGRAVQEDPGPPRTVRCGGGGFVEGLVVQLANPKIAVFILAFYPQFTPAGAAVAPTTAVLVLVQVAVETGLYLVVLAAVGRAGSWLRRPRVQRRLEVVSGAVLIGLGLRVAATAR
jgi:threonine/homoserine/homoserine lactone efflux protein